MSSTDNSEFEPPRGAKTRSVRRFTALLLGLLFVNLLSAAMQDLLVLIFYKTFGFIGQSTWSALVIVIFLWATLYIYIRTLPTDDIEGILL